MRYDKELAVPARSRSVLNIPRSAMKAEGAVRSVVLRHIRETEAGLVCAAGLIEADYDCPEGMTRAYAAADEVFAYCPGDEGKGYLTALGSGHTFGLEVGEVRAAVPFSYREDAASCSWYVVTEEGTVFLCTEDGEEELGKDYGGVFGAEYMERMFVASRTRISHTKPGSKEAWALSEDDSLQGFGYIDRPLRSGEYIGGGVLGERLYVFSERGVTEVRMGGETLAAKITDLNCDIGTIAEGTLAFAGDRFFFFTERGLYSFDGTFRHLDAPCAALLDLELVTASCAFAGRYYLLGKTKEGEAALYEYDALYGRESFLLADVDWVTAGFSLFAVKDGALYRFTERGLPPFGGACRLTITVSLGARDCVCAEWVRIEGKGAFSVKARTAEGSATGSGDAGKRIYLSRALFGGEATFEIETDEEDFLIAGLEIGIGEDERCDD